jgi:Flp pilus assembly protein TadD/SAM-dependent methyltransferase
MSRRRGRSRGQTGPSSPRRSPRRAGDPGAALAEALAAHRAGELDRATRLYQQALKAQPDDPDAHYLFGLLAHHKGEHDRALEQFDKALALRPDHAGCRNHRAEALAALGRLDEAEAALRALLRSEPGSPQVLNNLGNVLADGGRLGEAVEAYRKAAQAAPDFAEPHANLGAALARLGRLDEAQTACGRALALVPDHGHALFNLGGVHAESGRPAEAVALFERALGAMPNDPRVRVALAGSLGALGRLGDAAGHLVGVLEADPADDEAWSAAAGVLAVAHSPEEDRATARLLTLCLQSDHVAPEEVAIPAARAVRRRHALPDYPEVAARAALANDLAARLNDDDIACRLLVRCVNADPALEIVLTRLRRRILEDGSIAPTERFAAALAMQCFLNEYVFEVTAEETAAVGRLSEAIARAAAAAAEFPDAPGAGDLLRYALYAPLSTLSCAERLAALAVEEWPESIRPLVQAQLGDWLAERAIAAALPVIGAIADTVSKAVAAQYEDNPYPRWSATAPVVPESAGAIFARQFPHQPVPPVLDGPLDILVAGCGTGRHPIASVALRYQDCSVLAVDLSRSSLAYATRKASAMGAANIRFAQADILGLDALDRRFHLIECAGVLHHMADPLQGWRVLRDRLLPGGLMVIGLYSARARAAVVAARARIAALKLKASPADIRAFRRRLLLGEEDEALASLLDWPDFYSASGCRDLLFHAQEHRFTLPQIGEIMESLGLAFLGFENDDPAFWRRYRRHAPDDPAGTDLAAWDRLEANHPDMFAGMYQFWCHKTDR